MDVLIKVVDTRSKQEIYTVSIKKELLDLALQSGKFKYMDSKYEIVEFIPDLFDISTLVVNQVPYLYK